MTTRALLDVISSVFDQVLECSLQAGLVILIVLAIRAAVGRRLSGRWLHALWLIAMLRLALPWVPATHWSPLGQLPAIHWTGSAAPPATTVPLVSDHVDADSPALSPSLLWSTPSPPPVEPAASPRRPAIVPAWTPRHVVCLVWISGAIALGAFICWNVVRLRRAIVRERLLTDASVLNLLEDCKRQMGITAPVGIVVTDRTGSPALFGCLRPRLLMPPGVLESLEYEELRHVFLHELAHLRRHDVLISWIMCALQLLHWCNPLVWLAQSRMRADRELACDALALNVLQGQEPQQYGKTIVRLLEHFSRPRYIPALTGILEEKSQLKRRVTMIAEFKPQSRKSAILAIGLLGIVAMLALTTAPGVAAPDAGKPNAAGSATDVSSSMPAIYSQAKVYTIIPGKGLDILPVGATAQQVKTVFGEPDGKEEFTRSYKLSYPKAGLDFLVGKRSDQVNEIHFNEGFHGRLANGVRMGSTLDVLLSKLGQPKKRANASPEEAQSLQMGSDRVLYTQRVGKDIVSYQFADEKQGANYWFDKDKKLIQVVVYRPRGLEPNEITPADLPEGSRIDERGHIVDRIDWPFVNDPAALGKWESVDFVRTMEQFKPGEHQWPADQLFLKGLVFSEGGKANFGFMTWTKGLLIHQGDKTASKYTIKEHNGQTYMFFEWKSGDYSIRRQKPCCYVLKKLPADSPKFKSPRELLGKDMEGAEVTLGPDSHVDKDDHIVDKIDYPFVNDPEVVGGWQSVDFVREIGDFRPGTQNWQGDLFLKELNFLPTGKIKGNWSWTKGLVLDKHDKTASKYEIRDIQGSKYLFFEWKSGDYTILHRRPSYYVLRKLPAGDATKSNAAAEKAAIEAAQPWLGFVDTGNYAKSWDEGANLLRAAVNQEDLERSLRAARTPLGKVISRKVKSQQYAKALPGAPDGEYVVIQYQTKFAHKADAIETVTPMLDKDGKWRVSGYYIK